MKKICLVAHLNDLSGANKSLVDLASFLRQYYDVTVIVPRKGPLLDELKSKKIVNKVILSATWVRREKESLCKRVIKRVINYLGEKYYYLYYKKEQFDLIHYNSSIYGCGAYSARKLKIPYTWHIRELAEDNFKLTYFNKEKSRDLINSASKIITISQFMSKELKAFVDDGKLKVVYNGIAPKQDIDYIKSKNYNMVIIGSIAEDKGQIDAIRALKCLKVKYNMDIKLYVVGPISDYEYYKKLQDEISEDIYDSIVFTGLKKDVSEFRKQNFIALVCSRAEAFGRVTIEAMNEGQIVIGTTTGATPEIIKDKYNGFLYKAGDYTRLAEIIYYISNNDLEYIKLNGHQTIEKSFDIQNTVMGVKMVFDEII